MSLQISKKTLDGTTHCPNKFMCLTEGKCANCRIEELIPMDGVSIHGDRPEGDCPYLISFRRSWFCACPTRREIYRCYGQ
jgi:hypothetical protein